MVRRFLRLKGFLLGIFLLSGTVGSAVAAPVEYTMDAAHTHIGFSVKHLMVSNVYGKFKEFSGAIVHAPEDILGTKAQVTIQAASIDTDNEKRDQHLRSADFLDVEQYPEIAFKSTGMDLNKNGLVMMGELTLHGVTKVISIPVQIVGPVDSPFGGKVLALNGRTVINRQDFGVSWNKTLDNGGYVVANDVAIEFSVEASAK